MKVILIEDVDSLGTKGEVISVKEGYARNYLLPQHKAKPATAENMRLLEKFKKKADEEGAKRIEEAKVLAEKIASLSLTMNASAGEEEKLYGSVTSEMISHALAEQGIIIDKKEIILDEPIKKLGVYQVAVRVHPEVKATLRVWVVKE